jgi:hypothetical protein
MAIMAPLKSKTWRQVRTVASIAVVFSLAANTSRSTQYWNIQSIQLREPILTPIVYLTASEKHDSPVELHQPQRVEPDANTGLEMAKAKANSTLNVTSEHNRRNQSNNLPSETAHNPCGNSMQWLQGPRRGNLHDDPFLTDDLVQTMILDTDKMLQNDMDMSVILGQTICHSQSRFLNSTQPLADQWDERTVRVWAVKLIYLAMHYHQHRHAKVEAAARYSRDGSHCPSADKLSKDYDVGIFDYECPDAKYIVMPLGGNGLGANVRGGMVVALLMGLISDRVVLFVNHASEGNMYTRRPWSLASCPRMDYQCFFWATTPCTLTQADLKAAYELTRSESMQMIKRNQELPSIQHHKVWVFTPAFVPSIDLPKRAGEALYQHAQTLIAAVSESEHPSYVALLRSAAETIRAADQPRPGYNYASASLKVHHALSFYAMRPNPRNAHELDKITAHIIPTDLNPDRSIGLPVRGECCFEGSTDLPVITNLTPCLLLASDKCERESECLSFDQHMQVASDMWQKHAKKSGLEVDPTVVFTTEATSMVEEQKAFVARNDTQRYPFNFEFVTNTKDVTPDSGFMKKIGKAPVRNRCEGRERVSYSLSFPVSLCIQCR